MCKISHEIQKTRLIHKSEALSNGLVQSVLLIGGFSRTKNNGVIGFPGPLLNCRANRNVWSAALSQAKNEGDRLACANVFGLVGAQSSGP
jgi:hypothetical protein